MLVDYAPLFTLYQTTTIASFKHRCIQMHSILSQTMLNENYIEEPTVLVGHFMFNQLVKRPSLPGVLVAQ